MLTKISSWTECARRCAEKASCQNWVWNHEKARLYALNCALMEGFGNKVADSNSVAGRWDCNYKGNHRFTERLSNFNIFQVPLELEGPQLDLEVGYREVGLASLQEHPVFQS